MRAPLELAPKGSRRMTTRPGPGTHGTNGRRRGICFVRSFHYHWVKAYKTDGINLRRLACILAGSGAWLLGRTGGRVSPPQLHGVGQ